MTKVEELCEELAGAKREMRQATAKIIGIVNKLDAALARDDLDNKRRIAARMLQQGYTRERIAEALGVDCGVVGLLPRKKIERLFASLTGLPALVESGWTIRGLHLSARTWNALNQEGITLEKLVTLHDHQVRDIRNLGRKSLREIREALAAVGLTLGLQPQELEDYKREVASRSGERQSNALLSK